MSEDGRKADAQEECLAHTRGGGRAACQVSGQENGKGRERLCQADGTSWLKSQRKKEVGALGQQGRISHCPETP